jgi:hypothetical protein
MTDKIQAKKFFNPGWQDGKYLDLWSFVHILTGVILGLGVLIFRLPPGWSMLALTLGLIAYEFLEVAGKVSERWENIITDVVVGAAGAAFIIFYLNELVAYHSLFLALAVCIIANLILLYLGWHSFLKRKSQTQGTSVAARRLMYALFVLGAAAALASLVYWLIK